MCISIIVHRKVDILFNTTSVSRKKCSEKGTILFFGSKLASHARRLGHFCIHLGLYISCHLLYICKGAKDMNMKNEEKIYQLNTYNIAEYTSTDYTDNDIAILGDFKNLLFNKYFKLNANIYVVCVKGRLQININTQKYAIYPGEMLICMPNMILSNCTTSSDFKGAMFCLSTQITQKYLHKSSDIWNKAFYISQNPVVRIDKDRVQLFDLYYKVIRARMKQAEQPYYKEVIRSLIRTMLYELLADLNQLSTPPESQMVKRSNILFKRFLDLLACTEVKNVLFPIMRVSCVLLPNIFPPSAKGQRKDSLRVDKRLCGRRHQIFSEVFQ